MTLTHDIRNAAEQTINLTLDEARQLPDLGGRVITAMLKAHGFYTATVAGVKTLYVLRAS